MNCARFHQVLDAHIDGELDHATARDIAAHLGECAACAALRDQRLALRQNLLGMSRTQTEFVQSLGKYSARWRLTPRSW